MSLTVLYVIGDLDRGGAETHLARVLPLLRRQGIRPVVQTLTHEGELAPALREEGVTVHAPVFAAALRSLPRPVRRPLALVCAVAALLRRLLVERPTVVHCFLPQAYLLGGLCAVVTGVPVRMMSRRSLNRYQRRYRVLARLEHWLHGRMTRLIANSEAVRLELLAEPGVTADRLSLIYNGIDASRFELDASRADFRRELGIPAESLVLVSVANLIAYKGHEDLLRALSAIDPVLPAGWMTLFVGADGGMQEALRVLAVELGLGARVRWLGSRKDVPGILAASDMGLLCSHEEGFSNAILEGMASGLPMVVTAVGGNAEAVIHEETGLVVPPRSVSAIGDAIVRLAADAQLRQAYGVRGRSRVRERFGLERCVTEYAALYHLEASRREA